MDEVSRLTEEKERLEHLVVQLQFETETIGEYITLYQNQRRQLKHKELERNRELQQLAMDREVLKNKLLELNELIEQLLVEKRRLVASPVATPEPPQLTNGSSSPDIPTVNGNSLAEEPSPEKKKLERMNTKETAQKILALLTDIQTVNHGLNHAEGGVDHCACCQGKLDVV